jgi:hypothetical protein
MLSPNGAATAANVASVEDISLTPPVRNFWDYLQRQFSNRPPRTDRNAEWKALDNAMSPLLYSFVRRELKWAGGLALKGGYWINPKLGVKLCLKKGNVFYCGKMVGNYFDLWLIHRGLEWYDLPRARELLWAWIEEARRLPPSEHAIPPFTLDPAELDRIFFCVMFIWGWENKYRGTAKALWETFRKINGPIRTRRLQDFSSNEYLLKFFRYRIETPSERFLVEKISGPRKKEEIWEVWNSAYRRR